MTDKSKDDGKTVMAEQHVGGGGQWRECATDYNLSRHILPFLQDCAFYASISRHVKKRFTLDIPTAAVTFDPKEDEIIMYVNPVFMGGGEYTDPHGNDGKGELIKRESLTNLETRGILVHEMDHIIFGHLSARRRHPDDKHNIATDCAINSLIVTHAGAPKNAEPGQVLRALPKEGLVPGQRPYIDPIKFAKLKPAQQEATMWLCDLIEKFPPLMASEWYFHKLLEECKKRPNGGEGDEYMIGTMDSHDGWDGVPEDMREYVESKVKGIVEKAVRHADGQADGWGNIPAELQAEIRRSISKIIDWRAVLRQFIGSITRGERSTSIKRINRRYPYIHPGVKRGYTAKLFVALDESGSVSDEMLEMFFAELDGLTKKTSITLCHFDCDAGPKDLYEWKKGTRPKLKRVKGGGTNFDAPTNIVNDPKNRGRWDGMIICTDGQAPAPGPSRIKRAWVLGQGCKLNFSTSELVINLTKEEQMKGAWR